MTSRILALTVLCMPCALAPAQDSAQGPPATGLVGLAELLRDADLDPASPPPIGTPPAEVGSDALLRAPELVVLAHPEAIEMFPLRSGAILWGAVVEHDPSGVLLQRLDTGGQVRLPWSLLEPSVEQDLRLRFGYVDLEQEDVFVLADRIPLVDGSELIGIVQHTAGGVLHVKQETGVLLLPAARIGGPITGIEVPARSLFTREELYEGKRAELAASLATEGPEQHAALYDLGVWSERISDYAHAVEAYEQVPVGARGEFADFAARLERSRAKAKVQEQVDFLDEARFLAARDRYAEALDRLAEFPNRWSRSPLLDDWNRTVKQVEQDRDRELAERVHRRWFYWTSRLARQTARNENLEEVREWCQEAFPAEIAAKVAEDVDELVENITAEQVRAVFAERPIRSTRRATYGIGTWLLGRDDALAGLEVEEEELAALSDLDQERQQLLERIQRYQQNQQALARRSGDEGLDPQAFWAAWTLNGRSQWITAFYAENGGDFDVTSVSLLPHDDCAGTGHREIYRSTPDGDVRRILITDEECGGLGVKRRVTYR